LRQYITASIKDKTRENKLKWIEHVMREKKMETVRAVMRMNVKGRRGRPKK